MEMKTLREVKPGEYFIRKLGAKTVYTKGSYCRENKTFSCIDTEDICREIFLKANAVVYIGFTY